MFDHRQVISDGPVYPRLKENFGKIVWWLVSKVLDHVPAVLFRFLLWNESQLTGSNTPWCSALLFRVNKIRTNVRNKNENTHIFSLTLEQGGYFVPAFFILWTHCRSLYTYWGYFCCFILISWGSLTSPTFFFCNEPIRLAHRKKKKSWSYGGSPKHGKIKYLLLWPTYSKLSLN